MSTVAWCLTSKMIFRSQMSSLRMVVSSLYRSCNIASCSKEGEDQWSEDTLPSQLAQQSCADLDWKGRSQSSINDSHITPVLISLLSTLSLFFYLPNPLWLSNFTMQVHFQVSDLKLTNQPDQPSLLSASSHHELHICLLYISPTP